MVQEQLLQLQLDGGYKNLVGEVYWGEAFPGRGGIGKFLPSGKRVSPHPPSTVNPTVPTKKCEKFETPDLVKPDTVVSPSMFLGEHSMLRF